jgi:hypothetical protein
MGEVTTIAVLRFDPPATTPRIRDPTVIIEDHELVGLAVVSVDLEKLISASRADAKCRLRAADSGKSEQAGQNFVRIKPDKG